MKLIAIERISDYLPPGKAFEIPDHDAAEAEALVEAGLARHADPEPAPTEAPKPEPEPATPARRNYRRRDLEAEP